MLTKVKEQEKQTYKIIRETKGGRRQKKAEDVGAAGAVGAAKRATRRQGRMGMTGEMGLKGGEMGLKGGRDVKIV